MPGEWRPLVYSPNCLGRWIVPLPFAAVHPRRVMALPFLLLAPGVKTAKNLSLLENSGTI